MEPNRSGVLALIFLWSLQPIGLAAQQLAHREARDSVTVIPGPHYAKNGFVRFFAGAGYRDLWSVPLTVEIADLSKIGGGLTPFRLGGGMTTQTLHVLGNDGKRYVSRSVDKYPGQGLDEELRGTIYESILQDQISTFHPSGALILPPLLKAVGVLHVEPRLYALPDDPRLGEFREQFAGQLVIIEERPDEGPDDSPGFAGSRKIMGTQQFMKELETDPRNQLDSRAYLTARLVDLLVGDRDRSINNWWWARFDHGAEYLWKPIPRDRDQAFIQLDGTAKALLRLYEPRLVRFSQDVPNVWGLTRSAWDMDRPFLIELDKPAWDSVVAVVQRQLSDSVIEEAVRRMPAEHKQLFAETMAQRLKARRDRLQETADRFYSIVARYADVHATDVSELAVVEWTDGDHVTVRIHALESDGDTNQGAAYFRRTFDGRETREIRLYLHGGADRILVRGAARNNITLRVIGGGGADTLVDSSARGRRGTYFYDAGQRTHVVRQPGTVFTRRDAPRPRSWGETGPLSPDWGRRWLPRPAFPYTSDLGILVYAGVTRTGFGFRKYPYSNSLKLGAGYAPRENKFVADVEYEVRHLILGTRGSFRFEYSGIETLHFYGLGNDTEETEPRAFYKLARGRLLFEPVATAFLGRNVELDVGLRFEASNTDTLPDEPNFVSQARPYGSGSFMQAGAQASVRLDTRDRPTATTSGVFVEGGFSFYPEMLDVNRGAFGKFHGEATTFLSLSKDGDQTAALRIGAEKLWGTFPYYEAAFIGGAHTLRGFRTERFAGDASLYGSAELRTVLGHIGFLVPWDIGVFAFTDVGRVFVSGESIGGWHVSAGGGIWGAPLYRSFTGSFTVARSREGTTFYVGSGFGF